MKRMTSGIVLVLRRSHNRRLGRALLGRSLASYGILLEKQVVPSLAGGRVASVICERWTLGSWHAVG